MMRVYASTLLAIIIGVIIGCAIVFGSQGCLSAAKKKSALTLDCRVRLLEPYLGVLAPELVRETIVNGPRELITVLIRLGTDLEEVKRIGGAWDACGPATPTPPLIDAGMPHKLVKG